MSDLRVWVDGVERVVRGVNEDTTSESVLLALANATGKLGRFALLEKWRDLERILPREAKPVQCLQMWGKLAKEVQFVLKLMKDNSVPNEGKVGRAESGDDGEERYPGDDPFKRSFERNSLERTIGNQSSKLNRLSRDFEMLQLQHDCNVEDDEDFLYFTQEEITEDRITKLGQVSKLQSKELAVEETHVNELTKQRALQEKLRLEIQSQRNKLSLLDVHISDLENVGSKIYAMLTPQDAKIDNSSSNDAYNVEELKQEITITRDELSKQRHLAEKQSEEVECIKRSFEELENLACQKTEHLGDLKRDSSSDGALSYYDLDKNLRLDSEEDKSVNHINDQLLHGDKVQLMSSAVSQPPSGHGTIAALSAPRDARKKSAREKFLASGFDDLSDPGVFV